MTTLNHARNFGCEIELTGLNITQAADALRAAGITTYDTVSRSMGASQNTNETRVVPPYPEGVCPCDSCRDEWIRDHNRPPRPTNEQINAAWRVVSDGSVSNGCEVVSPILSGNEGLNSLRRVVRVLKAAGATVNRSCGFHVHVDAQDLDGVEIINAVSRYARYENEIDSFMAPLRRGDRSEWCHTMVPVAEKLLAEGGCYTTKGLQYLVSSRYHKLNICAYVRHGTLEFRQHAGTMNINKMVNWIIFAVNFVENSRFTPEFLANHKAATAEKRLAKIANLVMTMAEYDRQPWRVASLMGMEMTELPTLLTELTQRYPDFQGVRIDNYNNVVTRPRQRPQNIPAIPAHALNLPESPDAFHGLPEATARYLRARTEGYASRTRRDTATRTS